MYQKAFVAVLLVLGTASMILAASPAEVTSVDESAEGLSVEQPGDLGPSDPSGLLSPSSGNEPAPMTCVEGAPSNDETDCAPYGSCEPGQYKQWIRFY